MGPVYAGGPGLVARLLCAAADGALSLWIFGTSRFGDYGRVCSSGSVPRLEASAFCIWPSLQVHERGGDSWPAAKSASWDVCRASCRTHRPTPPQTRVRYFCRLWSGSRLESLHPGTTLDLGGGGALAGLPCSRCSLHRPTSHFCLPVQGSPHPSHPGGWPCLLRVPAQLQG